MSERLRMPPDWKDVTSEGTMIALIGATVIKKQMDAGQLPSMKKDFEERARNFTRAW